MCLTVGVDTAAITLLLFHNHRKQPTQCLQVLRFLQIYGSFPSMDPLLFLFLPPSLPFFYIHILSIWPRSVLGARGAMINLVSVPQEVIDK